MATIQDAIANQTAGIGYNADAWRMSKLQPGDRIYKMMPAAGAYYFNYEAYRRFGRDPGSMYGGLQVRVSQRYAMRVVVVEYQVLNGFDCPVATCDANAQHGSGGALQYFIPEHQRDSCLYQCSPGWGLDGKGIGYF